MKNLISISIIALISISAFSEDSAWHVNKWRIPTYNESTYIIRVNNALTGKDFCLSKLVGDYRVHKSFIYTHNSITKYLESKFDCKLLSEITISHTYLDHISLIQYNDRSREFIYAIIFTEFNKKSCPSQTDIICEFNKKEYETLTFTNMIETIVYCTNTIESIDTDLTTINFKFHSDIIYE